ncbi:ATP-binding cassette domain-containing protein [bacterium]|nr:ATP-binding cassette domain-containing protein [bacterium]
MIRVENVHKTLADAPVLRGVDLAIETGTMICLLGLSGAGKTVFLKNVTGLMTPDHGRVLIDGLDIHRTRGREHTRVLDSLGVLFQGGALFDSMTVYDNLAFPLREKTRMAESEIRERVLDHLGMVDMIGAERRYPAELSGGMKKRAALARALILDPGNVFFDEPTTGLDPLTANSILRLIHTLHGRLKFSGVVVTHDAEKVFQIVQKVAMLHKGKIIAYDTPETFMKSEHVRVREYIRGASSGPLEDLTDGA